MYVFTKNDITHVKPIPNSPQPPAPPLLQKKRKRKEKEKQLNKNKLGFVRYHFPVKDPSSTD